MSKAALQQQAWFPFNPDQVLSTIQFCPYTPPQDPAAGWEPWQPETRHNPTQLEQQLATIKSYLKAQSKSPHTPTDWALNQLVKGCQMAMQSAALLASENEQLRAANEKQTQKRNLKRRYTSKSTVISVGEASQSISPYQELSQSQDTHVNPEPCIVDNATIEAEEPPITCYICLRFDHLAYQCMKYLWVETLGWLRLSGLSLFDLASSFLLVCIYL
jgi:hypothetical protein